MKGKSYSIPLGMIFKKHYCSKCGERLQKEKTHRVVTPGDKDYFNYQDYTSFPRRDYDVYDYQYKCPCCGARISYVEQRIVDRIQKRCQSKKLTQDQIAMYYDQYKEVDSKSALTSSIVIAAIANFIACVIFYLFTQDKTSLMLPMFIVLYCVLTSLTTVMMVRGHKGKYLLKRNFIYSFDKQELLQKLHAYCSHNKQMVEQSTKCYCFSCNKSFDSSEIAEYIDDGETAICPHCGVDAILPDCIPEVDEQIVAQMHEYWF